MTKKPTTTKPRFYSMSFARVYPMYVKKAESKGRTKAEVDEIIRWLTGHTAKSLQKALDAEMDIETFYARAPRVQNCSARSYRPWSCRFPPTPV